MILDMFLSFGAAGLVATGCLLGWLIGVVQRSLSSPFRDFRPSLLVSLYALPSLLEFEKEFIGFFFAFLKWSPALLLVYWTRPRFTSRAHVRKHSQEDEPLQLTSPL